MAFRKRRSTRRGGLIIIWAILILLAIIGLWIIFVVNSNRNVKDHLLSRSKYPKEQASTDTVPNNDVANADIDNSVITITKPVDSLIAKPMVSIIVDDLGYASPSLVKRLCNRPVVFDVAILPYQIFTKQSAEIAHSKGKEIMLHLPMEPNGYPGLGKNPGRGAIMWNSSESEVLDCVYKAMASVPFSKGVNNHMGSRITQDRTRMSWVIRAIKDRKQFFVDSCTEKNSTAFDVATKLNVPAAKRQVFLDNDRSPKAMFKQWKIAMNIARTEGKVIIITHMHPETIEMLEKIVLDAKDELEFVPVSHLLKLN